MANLRLKQIVFEDVGGARVTLPTVDEAMLLRSLFRILKSSALCSIATVADRRPHINTAYFCYSNELELYFLSHPNAQHCHNLVKNSSAAVTVFSTRQLWGVPSVGVQLFGDCRLASARSQREAERLYRARFRAYRQWRSTLAIGQAGAEYRFYRLVVSSLKLLDEKTIADGIIAHAVVRRARGSSTGPRRRPTRG